MGRAGVRAPSPAAHLGPGKQATDLRVDHLEPDRAGAVPCGQHRDLPEDRILVVRALQVVVRDLGAQVVDVVEADVAGEELEGLRQLQVGAPAQRRVRVAPALAALPVDVLELVLDIEEPDACGPGEDRRRRDSIAELLELADEMNRRIGPIDRELAPLARADERAALLATMPGIGPLIGLTFAAEIGEVTRFASPGKLIGYAGLAPRVSQSGERSATGRLSKAGSRTLRWAAVEAANQAWRPTNPWHGHYRRIADRHGKNPAKSAVARKILIASWHMLSRREPFKAPPPRGASPLRQAPAAF